MKKIFTLAVVAIASVFAANAENWHVGGNIGYDHEAKNGVTTNSFAIMPEIGYDLNSTWSIGTQIGYQYNHTCGVDASLNMFKFNPYVRWTFFKTDNDLVELFVDGGAGIGLGWYDHNDDSHTAVTWNIGFRPGVKVNLTEKFSVVAHIGQLGYQGANNYAYWGGQPRKGGINLNSDDLTLGFFFNF
ncbi:MAG: porin family protein [Candidatus Amulumruptor caecigallinarius]|nr:porin family protein [Candidatus Amulumruptor caecigallinarius]